MVPFTDFVPVDFDDTGPGVVGEISVTRVLPRGQFALSYSRETRTTSSLFASDVNVDTYSLGWVTTSRRASRSRCAEPTSTTSR